MKGRLIMSEESNLITLYDEDGAEVQFEHLDTFEIDERVYIVLLEVLESGEENDEVVIFRLSEDENGEEMLSVIEDEGELMEAFAEFESRLEDVEE